MPDEPGVAGRIFGALAQANVNVDVIIQNEPVSHSEGADLSFTVERDDLPGAVEAIEALGVGVGVETDDRIGRFRSLARGCGAIRGSRPRFETLGEQRINIEMISTSPIKISCVIGSERVPDAVKALHAAFELGERDPRKEEPTGGTGRS